MFNNNPFQNTARGPIRIVSKFFKVNKGDIYKSILLEDYTSI